LKENVKFVKSVRNLKWKGKKSITMLKTFRIFFLVVLISQSIPFHCLYGQEKEGMVKYTPNFKFNDGVYLNFDQVKMNSPISKAKLLTSIDYNDRDFFKRIFESDKIYFYDDLGVRNEVARSSVWGYARNGVLYIQIQENFNRVTFVGNICHFVADITTYDTRYYNSPYGYYDPYYSPYGYSSYYNPYDPYYSPYRQTSTARSELKQYLIDFESGKVLEFDVENTELLLMKDNELYEEFVKLSKSKRKDLMFVYIRKFNEKNPLYIPVQPQN
jgi:hypothetical protein